MESATQVFSPEPFEVRHARSFVVGLLRAAGLPTEQAELITSELATNAVVHGRTEFRIRIDCDESSVRISVIDEGGGWPCRRPPAGDNESGRGLRIVDHLAGSWGVNWNDPGKVVWAEVPLQAGLPLSA